MEYCHLTNGIRAMDNEELTSGPDAADSLYNAQDSSKLSAMALFRPPVHRSATAVLDRALFSKSFPIAAARVTDRKQISKCRTKLEKTRELLQLERLSTVRDDPDPTIASKGGKCLLLQPEVKPGDPTTWSPILQQAVAAKELGVIPYTLQLDYDYWTYLDLMKAILPLDSQDEIPVGFSIVGHVAHLNLRPQYLPHKTLIATILLDKNPTVRTVINKTTTIDDDHLDDDDLHSTTTPDSTNPTTPNPPTTSDSSNTLTSITTTPTTPNPPPSTAPKTPPPSTLYRTFGYEVLSGPPSMLVSVREGDCLFRFDYSRVYWNSRLNTEHKRLVGLFVDGANGDGVKGDGNSSSRAGDGVVVVDVMAGVGPFAVPAGKKGVFVWANDLNPDSYVALKDAVVRNKVEPFVRPFNMDGHAFIPYAADQLLQLSSTGTNTISIPSRVKRSRNAAPLPSSEEPPLPPPPPKIISIPATISHFVMNLPASAISFLPAFRGLYAGHESLFEPHTKTKLPMVHVHCFSTKSDDNVREGRDICERISASLGAKVVPAGSTAEEDAESEAEIHDVRDVAPLKRMFCASFRLPASVAFAKRKELDIVGEVEHLAL